MFEEQPEGRKQPVANLVFKIFGIVMVVLYVVLGTTIIFSAPYIRTLPYNASVTFGIFLILYGIYRGYKVYRKFYAE